MSVPAFALTLVVLHQGMGMAFTVSDFMTRQPRTISLDDTLRQAVEQMQSLAYRRLPVLEGAQLAARAA